MLVLGTPRALLRSATTAALALPLSGTAATRRRRAICPSSRCSAPSIRSTPALGVTRTVSASPSAVRRYGTAGTASEQAAGRREIGDELLQEEDDDEHDDRAEIEPAHRRQDAADWPEDRLRHLAQRPPDAGHELVARVDDVEADQPAHDDHHEKDPPDQAEDQADGREQGVDHARGPCWMREYLGAGPAARKAEAQTKVN